MHCIHLFVTFEYAGRCFILRLLVCSKYVLVHFDLILYLIKFSLESCFFIIILLLLKYSDVA